MRYELRRREPLLEVRFFASAPFAGASAIAVCLSAALGGFLFMNTLYLQEVRGLSPLHAGLYMLPTAMMLIVFAPVSGRLVGRFGARPSMLTGGLAVLASGLMLTGLRPDSSVAFLLGAYAVFGFGFALVSPPIANTAVSGMPPAQAGVAAAVATTSRQVGDHARRGRARCRGGGWPEAAAASAGLPTPPGRAGGSSLRWGSRWQRSAT